MTIDIKKYTNRHLAKVPVEYILALEESVKMILDSDECIINSCPDIIMDIPEKGCTEKITLCEKYLGYKTADHKAGCPCYEFGRLHSAAMMLNLLIQWRQWAGIEDEK